MTAIREAAAQFQFVALHRGTAQLAAGIATRVPPSHAASWSTADAAARRESTDGTAYEELAAVYDLDSGTKRWALQSAGGVHNALNVACLAWSPSGDFVAAYAPGSRCLLVWWLVRNWSARFVRGPAALQPKGMAGLRHDGTFQALVHGTNDVGVAVNDLSYALLWPDEQHIQLSHHGRVVGITRWPFSDLH